MATRPAPQGDRRLAMLNELAEGMIRLHHARKLALAKGVLTDAQGRRLAQALHRLEDEISAIVSERPANAAHAPDSARPKAVRR